MMVSSRLVPSASGLPGQTSSQAGPPAMVMETNRILTRRIWTLTPTLRWDLGVGRNRPRGPCRGGQPWRNARTRVVNHAIHTLGGGDLYLGAIRGNRHHQTTRVENRFSFESARGPTATLPKIRWARRELKREKGVLITTTNEKSLGLVPKR